jgi:polyhydroxyalkanoate synthesis regulator phasin
MSKELEQLCNNTDPAISSRARMALDITAALKQGDISQDEYKELVEDLVRSDVLDKECSNLETKTMLVTAIYAVSKLV